MEKKVIEINTEKRSIKCDGDPLECVTYVAFEWDASKRFPNIRIDQDAKVLLSGTLITSKTHKLKCKCGYYVGEFIGTCSDVLCPSCGKTINS